MTVPDPTAPTAEDVVMFAMHDARCSDRCDRTVIGSIFGQEAAAVVAAVRAMSVEQKAELIGGTVAHGSVPQPGRVPGRPAPVAWAAKRVVGEWVPDCDDPDDGMFS